MRWLGHAEVSVLDGGYAAWVDSGGAIGEGRQDSEVVVFHGRPDSSMVATTEDILDLIVSGESCNLVDARDAPRFRGEVEPIDPVAGRIPGAINMPFPANLDGEGKWRQASELRDRWKEVLRDRPETLPIAMCGSGVTACHLIIAAERADLPLPRLYVGSWSEWIRDAERPVATG
jgi:thiosulfate/3-mercaptopyruvate sulfurtransferase